MLSAPFEYCDIIDWWEAERLSAARRCRKLASDLQTLAKEKSAEIPVNHLWLADSRERKNLETLIATKIQELDARLLSETLEGSEQDRPVPTRDTALSTYGGWSFWDLGKLVAGGGSAGGVAVASSRLAPGALAAIGLSTLAAPIGIAVGVAGLAFSVYSVSGRKRSDFVEALQQSIEDMLTSNETPEKSVLSRQLARLDAIRVQRLESLT